MSVYLIHFSSPLKHARHYIGWSNFIKQRIRHHRAGTGSKICKAAVENGIELIVAREWEGKDGNFERKLHNQKKASELCPICSGEKAYKRMKG